MLEKFKNVLRITWDDEDQHLQEIINRGKNKLQNLTGTDLDFETEGEPQNLLLDYCRYAYHNATEYFETNFKSEIVRLQLNAAIEAQAAEEEVVENE